MGGIVIFRDGPCETKEELYGRDVELNNLMRLVKRSVWVAVLGLRMAGKTSVAKVALNELDDEFFPAYVDLRGARGSKKAVERIIEAIPKKDLDRVGGFIQRNVKSFSLGPGGHILNVRLRPNTRAADVFEELVNQLTEKKKVLLLLDEVQSIGGGVNYFLEALARIKNTTRRVSIIFTGSEVNMMRALLSTEVNNPLHGRSPVKVEVKAWDRKVAEDFLKSGLSKDAPGYTQKEVEEVLDRFGTLPGWLNFYGVRRVGGMTHQRSLAEAESESIIVAKRELKSILNGRGVWSRKVVKLLGVSDLRWSMLKEASKAPDKGLADILRILVELYIATEENGVYRIVDPIYKRAAASL